MEDIERGNLQQEELFRACRKRFNEHLEKEYSEIKQFNDAKANILLLKNVPLDYLKQIFKCYWLLAKITQDAPANPHRLSKSSNDPLNYPSGDLSEIRSILKGLEAREWLQGTDIPEIEGYIMAKMMKSSQGYKHELETIKSAFVNKKGGPPPDIALNFVIYFLVEYLKESYGRPCYPDIRAFLYDQKIIVQGLDVEHIRRRYEKMEKMGINRLWMFFNVIFSTFEKKWFDELFKYPDIPEQSRSEFYNSCLPQFVDFFPPMWKERNLPTRT